MSIMFENIDGVASNFVLFSTKIISATNKISFLTLAETTLDECDKNLLSIEDFLPPIYQSKFNGKSYLFMICLDGVLIEVKNEKYLGVRVNCQ